MCDLCVIDAVKDRMLSRRGFFSGAAAGVGVTAAAAATPPALAAGRQTVEDMTHTLSADFPTYFGEPQFAAEQLFNYADHKFNVMTLSVNEHTGTLSTRRCISPPTARPSMKFRSPISSRRFASSTSQPARPKTPTPA